MKAGAVDGGAERMLFCRSPGRTEVSVGKSAVECNVHQIDMVHTVKGLDRSGCASDIVIIIVTRA